MMKPEVIITLGAAGLARAIASGRITASDATEVYFERIARFDASLRSFIDLNLDDALDTAAAIDAARAKGRKLGPLAGVPVAIKGNIDVRGLATTAGIGARRDAVADEDATSVAKLRAAGAVILGTLNLHEGALGATTDNEVYGRCINPHREGFTPGGSSGGSGAAVAAGLCAAALGTDTMGSIRIPAAYCGVTGFKPSFGMVSNAGAVACAWSLDHIGPLARSAADSALIYQAIKGFDPACPQSRAFPEKAHRTRRGRILVLSDLTERADATVQNAFATALRKLAPLTGKTRMAALGGDVSALRRSGLLVSEAESAHVHAPLLAAEPDGFTAAYRALLAYGAALSAPRLTAAAHAINSARTTLRALFQEHDLILLPTTPSAAFAQGGDVPVTQADLTCLANFAGLPAISLPMGTTKDGLPLGLQIWGPEGADDSVLAFARRAERLLGTIPIPGPFR